MDLLANLKTMVETRKISGAAMLTLDSYNERSQVGLRVSFFRRSFTDVPSNRKLFAPRTPALVENSIHYNSTCPGLVVQLAVGYGAQHSADRDRPSGV